MDEKQISELLECSVCLERFDQSCKVLPCQHTFCRQCLDEIISTKQELRCPECRALVTIRVSDLPTNILVVRILEGLKTKGLKYTGCGGRQHAAPNSGSSPSKAVGSSQLTSAHDPASNLPYRQGTQPCAKALYNYDSSEKNDLPFKKGDILLLRRKIDDNWFHGEIGGRSGFFPSNFIQVLVPLPPIPQCVTLYDFELRDEGEKDCLSFKKDEVLTVIRRVDENWLEGRKGDKIGIFPITFVKLNEAARSLINTKSNLNILPGFPVSSSTSSTSSSSSNSVLSSGALSSKVSPKTDANSTAVTNTTAIAVSTTNSSTLPTNSIAESDFSNTSSIDNHQTVLPLLETETSSSETMAVATSSDSQIEPTIITDASAPSSVTATPEMFPQNKRHSFTSPSLSSPVNTVIASSDRTQQRHSAEATLTYGGTLSLVSTEEILTLSSSILPLPSSVALETDLVVSQSPKNCPLSPIATSEATAAAATTNACGASSSSGSGGQTVSLTTPVYIALYNYKPKKDDELELHKGDHYTVVEKCQDGWYKGSCVRSGVAGVFPGNYVQVLRHSSAFKPVSSTQLNVRAKGPSFPAHSTTVHSAADQQPVHAAGETSTQAPPLMPRVAKMNNSGQLRGSPLSHLGGAPLRSLSSPANTTMSSSPKHHFASQLSSSSSPSPLVPPHIGLSRPLIPAPPPSITSSPHHSLWVPPSVVGMQSASSNITQNMVMSHGLDSSASAGATSGKEKKEKKEKEKKSLVKLLSGKGKKSKPVPIEAEPSLPLAVVSFDSGVHFRSGSFPVNGTSVSSMTAGGDSNLISSHRKAASFDATTVPPIPAKPRPKLTVRERYCCIVPYPPQTEHELSLELGDIIHVHRKRDDGWYKGTQERTGKTGMFPASFVEKCE